MGPMLDPREAFSAELATVVGDEPILAMTPVTYVAGRENRADEKPGGLLDWLGDRLVPAYAPRGDEFVTGHSMEAQPGSQAWHLKQALADLASADLLLTPTRLVLIDDRSHPTVRFEVPAQAVRFDAAPRPLQRGRVCARFLDGSWLMLMTGLVSRNHADALVAARATLG